MFKPVLDNVIVKPYDAVEKTAGGIYVPKTVQDSPNRGEVIAVGPGKKENGAFVEMQLKVGDEIIYNKNAVTEIEEGGIIYHILKEENVFTVIEKE